MSDPMHNIRCPVCGTINAAGTRFCIECSTRLPDAGEPAGYAPTLVLPHQQGGGGAGSPGSLPPQKSKRVWIIVGSIIAVVLLLICAGGAFAVYQVQQAAVHLAETATAQAAAAAQAETATAQAGETATAQAQSAAAAQAQTTTALANETATAAIQTATARSEQTAAAQPAETATTDAMTAGGNGGGFLTSGTPVVYEEGIAAAGTASAMVSTIETNFPEDQLNNSVYGPESGDIEHETGYVKRVFAEGIELQDFGATVTFHNPYSAEDGLWDYGIVFDAHEKAMYYFDIDSSSNWELSLKPEEGEYTTVAKGTLNSLDLTDGGTNEMVLLVYQGRAILMINEEDFVVVEISDNSSSGRVGLFTSLQVDHEKAGAITHYEDFELISLDQ